MARLNDQMTIKEAIDAMSDDGCGGYNAGAFNALARITTEEKDAKKVISALLFLDSLGIYDWKICKLWYNHCKCSTEKFFKVLQYFKEEKCTKQEIHHRLTLIEAKPFI